MRERDPEGNRTLATIEIERAVRADPPRRAGDAAPEDAARRDLRRADARARRARRRCPRTGGCRTARVAEAVEFDELLTTFDAPTRKAFQRVAGDAAPGDRRAAASDLNDALGNLPGFVESGADARRHARPPARGAAAASSATPARRSRRSAATRGALQQHRSAQRRRARDAGRAARARSPRAIQIFPTFLDESRARRSRAPRRSPQTPTRCCATSSRVLDDVAADAALARRRCARRCSGCSRTCPRSSPPAATGLPALSRVLRGLDPTLAAIGPFLQQLNPVLEFLELYQSTVSDFISIGASAPAIKRRHAGRPGADERPRAAAADRARQPVAVPTRERSPTTAATRTSRRTR